MSLQKCPNCKKEIGFWKVYKKINQKRFYNNHLLKCKKCKTKLSIKLKKKTFIEHLFKGFLWMFFPIFIIVLVYIGSMTAILAIGVVILYHILSMIYIIKTYKYKIIKK